ncbi:MAG: hypothetical protein RSB94_08435 [Erysipelotrichaceae bacterium]
MQEYNKITIYGGYHDGEEYDVLKGLEHITLLETILKTRCYDEVFNYNDSVKEHRYRKLDTTFRKQYNRGEVINSWLELDDLNIYIPVETTQRQEGSLKKILSKALNANWTRKHSERG